VVIAAPINPMQPDSKISFGDNVRVRSTPITEEHGLAGLSGDVHGETTPSVTGIEVIGQPKTDYAINVFFESRKKSYWFASDLLEFVDHAAGAEITLKGVPKRWGRSASGEWIEQPQKPWWRFW
jgi:hypothetical protein